MLIKLTIFGIKSNGILYASPDYDLGTLMVVWHTKYSMKSTKFTFEKSQRAFVKTMDASLCLNKFKQNIIVLYETMKFLCPVQWCFWIFFFFFWEPKMCVFFGRNWHKWIYIKKCKIFHQICYQVASDWGQNIWFTLDFNLNFGKKVTRREGIDGGENERGNEYDKGRKGSH